MHSHSLSSFFFYFTSTLLLLLSPPFFTFLNPTSIMPCFLSGGWFRSLIKHRKSKKGRSKNVKVHSDVEKSNSGAAEPETETETETLQTEIESGNVANGDDEGISHAIPVILTEHLAAKRIQTAFRAHKARKSLRRLRGAVRFNVLIQGHDTQKQALSTLNHLHSWSNIQAQIRDRRYHMVTEGRIKQKKLENQIKLEAKLHDLEVEWHCGSETMEEIMSRIQQREEAAVKRERAMAYAFSHQWRANPTQYLGQAYYNLGKENWGWSWKERWIAARPWEIRVNSQPLNPKKIHSRQASKSEIRASPYTKPGSANGKTSTKAKKLPSPTAEYQDGQEANASVSPC